jgi:hypothetical protein
VKPVLHVPSRAKHISDLEEDGFQQFVNEEVRKV